MREIRRTGEQSWGERARAALRPEFRGARSWADLRGRLQAHGYRLEPRGRGLVTDGKRSIKASRIARSVSAHRLAARFGQTYPEWSRAHHDTLTAATEVRTASELLTAAQRAAAMGRRLHRTAKEAEAAYRQVRIRNVETVHRLFRDLDAVHRDPGQARRALLRYCHDHKRSWIATAKVLEERPATFGRLRGSSLVVRREVRRAAHRAAHSARQLAHLRPKRARLAAGAREASQDYLAYERRTAARQAARLARARQLAAQRRLAAAVRRGTKDLTAALPIDAQRAVRSALRLTRPPTPRTALSAASGRMIPRTAATAALAFGASALRFAVQPNPLTAVKAVGASVRALSELGRDNGR